MIIEKADYMGFCFGVKNAVNCAIKLLDEGEKIYSLGEIIHNEDALNRLKDKGLTVIDKLEDTVNIDNQILIRAHGVGKNVIEFFNKNKINYIDATCVKVKKIHEIVDKYSNDGYEIIIVGDAKHPEVIGIAGWTNGIYHILENIDEFKKFHNDLTKKYCIVFQTTFNYNIYKEIVEFLNENDYTNMVRYNTICDATKMRQDSCVHIAKKSDVMLVIGGKNSSNTKKLFEICKDNCEKTFLIENYREIPYKYIDKKTKIGITAGASTPDWVIEEVILYVRKSEQNNE